LLARQNVKKTVGAYEAKTHLPKLLSRVEKGERITITRHGVPIAVLSPVGPREQKLPDELIEEIREFSRGRDISLDEIRSAINEGRKE
jgi:prevent-host-death family protein